MGFNDPNASNAPLPVTGVPQTVTGSTSPVLLLADNPRRKGATFYNADASNGKWFLQLGTGISASLSSYSVEVRPGWYYEVPFFFTGDITGVCQVDGPNTQLTINEVT